MKSLKIKKIATKLNNIKASIADIKSKTVYNSEFDFYIDTEQALYVESNDSLYHSYTFQINRTTPSNNLENLFLSLQADGSYKSYIVTYNVTEQEKNQIYNNVQVNLENKVSYLEIDDSSMQNDIFARETPVCIYVVTTSCSQGNHVDGYLNGAECPAHQFTVTQFCTSTTGSGGTSSGDYSGGDGSLGGSPGTGSGGGGNSNDPVTTPVYVKQPWEKVLECLGPDLSSESLAWLQEVGNKRTADQISSYLDENNCDANAKEFVEELIEGLVTNTQPIYASTDYPGDSDGMPFKWWNNEEFIIENFKIKDESNSLEEDPNEREILLFMAYPAQAILHIKNSNLALDTSVELVENGILTRIHNGKADAFRHAYWNAFDTAQFGSYVTKLFTDAHEWNSGNQPLESLMDFYNNQIGRNVGQNLSFYSTPDLVKYTILNEIAEGNLKYLTPLANHDGNNILTNTLIKFTNQ